MSVKFQKAAKYKKCPRCGNKCLINQSRCEECDLIFSRMEFASNKAAKRHILHGDRDFVIKTDQLPKDVKRWKLVLLTILTGVVGGQYFYVGKFLKGILMCLMFVYWVLTTVFNAQIVNLPNDAVSLFYAPVGVYAFAWMVSVVYVLCKKFKVPVIVEMPQDVLEEQKSRHDEFVATTAMLEKTNKKNQNEKDQNKMEGEKSQMSDANKKHKNAKKSSKKTNAGKGLSDEKDLEKKSENDNEV